MRQLSRYVITSRRTFFSLKEEGARRKTQEFMEELKLARTENRLGVAEFNGWSLDGDLP